VFQRCLALRAQTIGLMQVVVIDEDLGRSGASAAGRSGFAELVADVGLGKAGIIPALEVSGWPGRVPTGTSCCWICVR
jgi:DNA invertase Pin-like site-specific DNA recombinase